MRFNYRKLFVLGLLLCVLDGTRAQAQADLPKVLPPSPEAAQLFKFLDHPVDHSTGVTSINIPLYEVKSGNLSIPISISYHASGRKVSDVTGPVGLGWTLNAGGMISRTIYGKPDEVRKFPSPFKSAASINQQIGSLDEYEYLEKIYYDNAVGGSRDTEYDVYSYNFGGNSGKFIQAQDPQRLVMFPVKPYKIPSSGFPTQIIDEQGNKYGYNSTEMATFTGQAGTTFNYQTGAYLSDITSADGKDNIAFSYTSFALRKDNRTQYYLINDDYRNPYGNPIPDNLRMASKLYTKDEFIEYSERRISEIRFKEGKVVFTPVLNSNGTASSRIKQIQVLNLQGVVLKNYEFTYSLLDNAGATSMYKLDQLVLKDGSGNVIEKHGFDYNPSESFVVGSRDYWGYRNGSNQLDLMTQYWVQLSDQMGSRDISEGRPGNRRADPSYMIKGMLRKVTYPTGGSTEFSYEGNTFQIGQETHYGGGVRIAQIKTTDNQGKVTLKSYQYPKYGRILYTPYGATDQYRYQFSERRNNYLEEHLIDPCNPFTGQTRDRITYYRIRTYTSDIDPRIGYFLDQPITYDCVTEYQGTATNNVGKTDYCYSVGNPGHIDRFPTSDVEWNGVSIREMYYPRQYNYWNTTTPASTTYFENAGKDAQGNIQYNTKKSISYNYVSTPANDLEMIPQLMLYKFNDFTSREVERCQSTRSYFRLPVYLLADSYISAGKKELISTTETDYFTEGTVVKKTEYTYHPNSLLKESRTTVNNGDQMINRPTYVFDPAYATTLPYKTLLERNQLSVVEQQELKNTTPLRRVKTTYKDWGNSIIAPEVVSTSQGGGPLEPRITSKSYDAQGNLLQVAKEKGIPISYLWGYNQVYPIAQITNASASQVAYSSFETDTDKGNWTYAGLGKSDIAVVKTGLKYYSMASGTITSANLPAGSYWLTYWAQAGNTVTLSGHSTVKHVTTSPADANGWIYYCKQFTLTTAKTIQLSGAGNLDELRLYPEGAQMITYTYQPLVGVSSTTDAANATTHYEYDAIGRLRNLRDQDRNILKNYVYSMANPSYINTAKSGTFTRNNCPVNYNGSTVTYTVPAGRYTSNISVADADARAQQDVNENGQEYANQVGNCSTFQNTAQSGTFTRNNCPSGSYGSAYTYVVAAGTYQSAISQADADNKAKADVTANGQTRANTFGTCAAFYYNVAKSGTFTRNNCGTGYVGTTVTYTVPAQTYQATSQAAADAMAENDVNTKGQPYANTNGSCLQLYYNTAISQSFQKGCPVGYTGNMVTYTVPANKYSSTVSQQDAQNQAINELNTQGPINASNNGTCSTSPTISVQVYNSTQFPAILRYSNSYGSLDFNIPASSNGSPISVPTGTYGLSITLTNADPTFKFTFKVPGQTDQRGYSASFSNVTTTSGSIFISN